MDIFNELIKQYYKAGLYTIDDLPLFVQVGYISKDDYKQLTGKDYVAPTIQATTTSTTN